MIYYMIRHKATGEFMPQLKGKGYSHWNPNNPNSISSNKFTGSPRLLPTIRIAKRIISQWNSLPNAFNNYRDSTFSNEGESFIDIKLDGRKKEDLEVVEVDIILKEKDGAV